MLFAIENSRNNNGDNELENTNDPFCTLTATTSDGKTSTVVVYVVGGTNKGTALQYGMIYDLPGVAIFLNDIN